MGQRTTKRGYMKFKIIKESIIDKPKETINPYVWKNETLNPQIKEKIIKILNDKNINYNNIYIIGSITGTQYSEESDIDITVFVKLNDEETKSLRKTFKIINERNYFGGFALNYYFRNSEIKNLNIFDGIYDVINDQWIKKATKIENIEELLKNPEIIAQRIAERLDMELDEISDSVVEIINRYNNKDFNVDEKLNLLEIEIKQYIEEIDDVHKKRIEGFNKAMGEGDLKTLKKYRSLNLLPSNIIFKFLEKNLYFKIAEIFRDITKNEELKIKEVKELYSKFVKFWM